MLINRIKYLSKKLKSNFSFNYDSSQLSWFRSGGIIDIYCLVENEQELKILLENLEDSPYFVVGAGSNLLIRDGGYRGTIIKLGKSFNNIELSEDKIYAGGAVLDVNLSKFALNNSISKLEFYSGIPGSIGGAVKMNAGCFGSQTMDVLCEVSIITKKGIKKNLKKEKLDFSYRTSNLSKNDIVTSAIFHAKFDNKLKIKENINEIKIKRKQSQPIKNKTGGSTFKNPKGYSAAKLIEEANCKGLMIGDAIVSQKHSNFLINTNQATSKNIEDLGNEIKTRVLNKFNINLDWEIKIIGDNIV